MRFKLNFLLLCLVTLLLVATTAFSYISLRSELEDRFQERKQELAKRLQVNLTNALWNYDENQASSVIEAELDSPMYPPYMSISVSVANLSRRKTTCSPSAAKHLAKHYRQHPRTSHYPKT